MPAFHPLRTLRHFSTGGSRTSSPLTSIDNDHERLRPNGLVPGARHVAPKCERKVRLPVKLGVINGLSVALALIPVLAGCDRPGPTANVGRESAQAMQPDAANLVEPHRYMRLSDLADAIRAAGHGCEAIRTYKLIERKDDGSAVYKIDCLEYSFRLTLIDGQSRVERWNSREANTN